MKSASLLRAGHVCIRNCVHTIPHMGYASRLARRYDWGARMREVHTRLKLIKYMQLEA